MKLVESYNAMMRAEIEYAYFNARRTLPTGENSCAEIVELDNGVSLVDPSRPANQYYNRLVLTAELREADFHLSEIPSSIQAVEVQMPQQILKVSKQLADRGWLSSGSLGYLHAQPCQQLNESHNVVRLQHEKTQLFFSLIGLPAEKQKPNFYCTSQFRCYVAYTDSNKIAAWATMFVGSDFAFFGNAETLLEHQNKGFHSALLSARLNDVVKLGLCTAYTDVVPGSKSQRNCERVGFSMLAVNQVWGRRA